MLHALIKKVMTWLYLNPCICEVVVPQDSVYGPEKGKHGNFNPWRSNCCFEETISAALSSLLLPISVSTESLYSRLQSSEHPDS